MKYINNKEDGMGIYMKDVRKTDLINAEREVELAKRIEKGDERALNELVSANLRFVIKIAKRYQNQGVPIADLISEGNYGLITAAKKFDHTKGFRFISYAIWWIKQCIIQIKPRWKAVKKEKEKSHHKILHYFLLFCLGPRSSLWRHHFLLCKH